MNQVLTVQMPACVLIQTGQPNKLVSGPGRYEIEVGPEESELYEYMTGEYVYGAPVGDPLDPNHPKDADGNLIRKRSPILRTGLVVTR